MASLGSIMNYGSSPLNQSLGGGKTQNRDRMANIADRQVDIAEAQWKTYQNTFIPYEEKLVAAQSEIIPSQLGLDLATIRSKTQDVTGRMGINREIRSQQMRSLQRSEPVEAEFYNKIMEGVNVQDQMNAAGADVSQAYDANTPQMQRQFSRMGVNPQSGKFTDAMAKASFSRAKDIAFARTNARRGAQQQNLANLGAGMQMRGNIAGLTSGTGSSATNPLNQGMAGIGLQKAGQSLSALQGASGTMASLAQQKAGDTQTAVSGASTVVGMMSDERLKTNITQLGYSHNMPWYMWEWNETANKKFGLTGVQIGHMATDVELKYPDLILLVDGYRAVNYGGLINE